MFAATYRRFSLAFCGCLSIEDSMFDVLLKELATRLKLGDRAPALLSMLLSLIFDEKRGGFQGFLDRFRAAGMQDALTSWLGNGENRSMTLSQLESVLGNNVLQQISARLDLAPAVVSTALGQLIPTVIDKLSPDGKLPQGSGIPEAILPYLQGEHAKFAQIAVLPEVHATRAAAHTLAHGPGAKRPNWLWLLLIPILCAPLFFMRGCDRAPVGAMQTGQASEQVKGPPQPAGEYIVQSEPAPIVQPSQEPNSVADVHADGLEQDSISIAPAEAALDNLILGQSMDAKTLAEALNLMVVYFDTGKSEIKAVSLPLLDKAAQAIKKAPAAWRVAINGHTDTKGDAAQNEQLSQARADAVLKKLVELGVTPGQLSAKGFGGRKPIASNDDDAGRAKNRRIEFLVSEQ
jgi:outer membrane protein OmpA-like peptidoglycan-associated protein/uncharacterized protein YidB (DUF937 family)